MHLVPRTDEDYFPAEDFQYAFLLCSRFYIKPHDLLPKIIRIWTAQALNAKENMLHEYISNMVKLLGNWLLLLPQDFRAEPMQKELHAFASKCEQMVATSVHKQKVAVMLKEFLQSLENALTNKPKTTPNQQKESPKQPKSSLEHSKSSNSIFDMHSFNKSLHSLTRGSKKSLDSLANPIQLSQQLTFIELQFLGKIQQEELVGLFANDFHNLDAYREWSKKLSYLVATEIVKVLAAAADYWASKLIFVF